MISKTFSAELKNLHEMLEFVCLQAEASGMGRDMIATIELASEEALVNIIKHGYKGLATADGEIQISCQEIQAPKALEITIKDQGVAFNPLTGAPPIPEGIPVDQMPIGGYGVFLIRKIMDQVAYKREGGSNVLTLTKEIKPSG